MDKISEAICFATSSFDGMVRKCENFPAVLHSLEAATIARTLTSDMDIVVAATLHDTVEDAGVTPEELRARFGERVTALVLSETENKRRDKSPSTTWKTRKLESIEHLKSTDDIGVKILFLSDKLSNMRSLFRSHERLGDELWNMFNQKDKAMHEWYYRSIADAISELSDTPAYREYISLIDKTFKTIT